MTVSEEWRADAACLDVDPNLFFPGPGEHPVTLHKGKPVGPLFFCQNCEVREPCRDDAIAHGDFGIRGGLSERARRAFVREYRQAKRAAQVA